MAGGSLSLPVLDLSRLAAGASARHAFLDALRQAAHDTGFFYLTGHGVPASFNAAVLEQAAQFFALPQARKEAVAMVRSPHFRGYNRAGLELTRGQPDWREQIDIGAERGAVPDSLDGPAYRRLQGPNQWPATLPDFRKIVLGWEDVVTGVLVRLLRAFALALGQDEDVFGPVYDGSPHQLLKLIRYPGQDDGSSGQGVGAHKDSGLLSLILQDGQGGLEIEVAPHVWIPAPPRPDAFVVNIGELLELATGGYLRATVHRVVSPPAGQVRLSAAFFRGARLDATMPVLRLPAEFAAAAGGVAQDPDNPLFRQVGLNTLKGRLRSHPDVARRHHADLLEPAGHAL